MSKTPHDTRRTRTTLDDAHATVIARARRLAVQVQTPCAVYLRATLDDWGLTDGNGLYSVNAVYFVKPITQPAPADAVLVWQTP